MKPPLSPGMAAYKQRRQQAEMKRLYRACFGEKPVSLDRDEVLRRIKRRRKRGQYDAESVLTIGIRLGYAVANSADVILIDLTR